jgi:lipopolysaccharide/colanic/teichoic acid biosynthesis glycosyltransferase
MLSLSGLIIFTPIFIILILIIFIDSKGSVFYVQDRVGKDNHDFKLIKFRSMVTHSDSKGLLTIGNTDSRITRVGKIIRKYKIDELPQLINVLRGDMSMVGPRPEVRKYVDMYTDLQRIVLTVRPGITDYASIYYINENKILSETAEPEKTYIEKIMPDKIKLNLKYIDDISLKRYFSILFFTVLKIFKNL